MEAKKYNENQMSKDTRKVENLIPKENIAEKLERALVVGDLGRLTESERVGYYKSLCESLGLNPLTKPFEYIVLNNKLTLYPKKDTTDQLRKLHKVSISEIQHEVIKDCWVVTAKASTPDGRVDSDIGAVFLGAAKGADLANLMMKANTKAKRRVTLSIVGLGMLSEDEITDIPNAKKVEVDEEGRIIKEKQINEKFEVKPQFENIKEVKEIVETSYIIPFGKFKGKRINEIELEELDNYTKWLINMSREQNKPLKAASKELVEKVQKLVCEAQQGTTQGFFQMHKEIIEPTDEELGMFATDLVPFKIECIDAKFVENPTPSIEAINDAPVLHKENVDKITIGVEKNNSVGDYTIKIGIYVGKQLKNIAAEDLALYLYQLKKQQKLTPEPNPQIQELIEKITKYIET